MINDRFRNAWIHSIPCDQKSHGITLIINLFDCLTLVYERYFVARVTNEGGAGILFLAKISGKNDPISWGHLMEEMSILVGKEIIRKPGVNHPPPPFG